MMAALAALVSLSPALLAAVLVLATLAALLTLVAVEAAWLGLSRPTVHRALEARPASVGLQLWLQAPTQLWLALHATRAALYTALGAWTMLRVVPAASATLGVRGVLLWGPWLLAVGLSLAMLQATGQALGRRHARALGLGGMQALGPLAVLLLPLSALCGRLVHHEGASAAEGPFWTADAITHVVRHAHQEQLGERSIDLFASLSEFSDTVIREIMVPRTEVVSLATNAEYAAICQQVLAAGHSRMPVYEETIDHITGVLHVKDLFAAELRAHETGEPVRWQAMLRPTFFVPEVMQISLLLREFQRRKTHLAIVVDEYGGTAGVVTLEDIIEEIVGEIQDEYDVEEKQFRVLPDGKILADARVGLWDLEQALGVSFPQDGEYETLAGFLMSITGALPQRGAQIGFKGLRFTIKEANARRLGMVEIERLARQG
jgi:putative hemolysin